MSEYVNQRLPGIEFYTSDSGSLFSGKGDDSPVKVENGKEITSWENEDSAYLLDNVLTFLVGCYRIVANGVQMLFRKLASNHGSNY